jgi:hypothetical protein
MEPVNWGEKPNDGLRNKRVRTLMNKYVGMSYYRLPLNDNPRSVLYRMIAGLGTLDGIDERIPIPSATPRPTATPVPVRMPESRAEEIGFEIARTYLEMMEGVEGIVAPHEPPDRLEAELSAFRDRYSEQLAVLGCLTDSMSNSERQDVFSAAAVYENDHLPPDRSWLEEAQEDYRSSPAVVALLDEMDRLWELALPQPNGERRIHPTPCGD